MNNAILSLELNTCRGRPMCRPKVSGGHAGPPLRGLIQFKVKMV